MLWVRLGDGNSGFGGVGQGVLGWPVGSSTLVFLFRSKAHFLNNFPLSPCLLCFTYYLKVYVPSYSQVTIKEKKCSGRTPKAPKATPTEHSGLGMKLDIVQKLTPTSQACGCWVLSSNSFAPQSSSFWAVLLANVDIKLAELPGIPQGVGRGSDLKGFKKSLYLSVYGIHFGVRYLLNLEKMHHPIYLSVISQQWCTDKLFSQNWWASIISGTKGKIKMLWLHKLIGGLFFSFFFTSVFVFLALLKNMGMKLILATWQGTKSVGEKLVPAFDKYIVRKNYLLNKTITVTSLAVLFDFKHLVWICQECKIRSPNVCGGVYRPKKTGARHHREVTPV